MRMEYLWACCTENSHLRNRRKKCILRELGCGDVGWMDGSLSGSSRIATFGIGDVRTSGSAMRESVS
jgi:hypothetical protein